MSLRIIYFNILQENDLVHFINSTNIHNTKNDSILFYFYKTDSSINLTSLDDRKYFELRIFLQQKEIHSEFIKSLIVRTIKIIYNILL